MKNNMNFSGETPDEEIIFMRAVEEGPQDVKEGTTLSIAQTKEKLGLK
jgi:hypothetical protein